MDQGYPDRHRRGLPRAAVHQADHRAGAQHGEHAEAQRLSVHQQAELPPVRRSAARRHHRVPQRADDGRRRGKTAGQAHHRAAGRHDLHHRRRRVRQRGTAGRTVHEGRLYRHGDGRSHGAMGDNRQNSRDSRDPLIGFVDEDDVLGKAVLRLFPFSKFGGLYD